MKFKDGWLTDDGRMEEVYRNIQAILLRATDVPNLSGSVFFTPVFGIFFLSSSTCAF